MIIKKILDKPIGKPVEKIRHKIDEKLRELMSDTNLKYLIKLSYSWHEERLLLIKSDTFQVRGALIILDKRVKVYIKIPAHLSSLLSYIETKCLQMLVIYIEEIIS